VNYMLRERLGEELKQAMKSKDTRRMSTLRLIIAALKDREIAARSDGKEEAISDQEIISILSTMVRQRRESIELYSKGGRDDLVQQEEEEAAIISSFLPKQLEDNEVREAIRAIMDEIGASGIKDMGRVMGELKRQYAGSMDFGSASGIVKELLSDD